MGRCRRARAALGDGATPASRPASCCRQRGSLQPEIASSRSASALPIELQRRGRLSSRNGRPARSNSAAGVARRNAQRTMFEQLAHTLGALKRADFPASRTSAESPSRGTGAPAGSASSAHAPALSVTDHAERLADAEASGRHRRADRSSAARPMPCSHPARGRHRRRSVPRPARARRGSSSCPSLCRRARPRRPRRPGTRRHGSPRGPTNETKRPPRPRDADVAGRRPGAARASVNVARRDVRPIHDDRAPCADLEACRLGADVLRRLSGCGDHPNAQLDGRPMRGCVDELVRRGRRTPRKRAKP